MNGRETAEALLAPPDSLATSNLTPVELLRIAVSQNADIDKLTKLMDLQERWERNEAKKAFVVAMNAFKANPPVITKNKHVAFKEVAYDHATLDHVCKAVTEGLTKHGISHRWKMRQDAGLIEVTCILTHDLGHSEETTLSGTADSSGSKNSIQAIGSTVTYLQRYTLLAATGLAASNGDDDANGASNGASNGELTAGLEWIEKATSKEELSRLYAQLYEKFEAYPPALKSVIAANRKRRGELK